MTRPEWEPLTTAEAAVRALSDGRVVEVGMRGMDWSPTVCETVEQFKIAMYQGLEYRARIEGGAE